MEGIIVAGGFGTPPSLIEGLEFVRTLEKHTDWQIGCVEAVACRERFIDEAPPVRLARHDEKSDYGRCVLRLAEAGPGTGTGAGGSK